MRRRVPLRLRVSVGCDAEKAPRRRPGVPVRSSCPVFRVPVGRPGSAARRWQILSPSPPWGAPSPGDSMRGPCPECASKRASAPHTFCPPPPVPPASSQRRLGHGRARQVERTSAPGLTGSSQRLSGTKRKLGRTGRQLEPFRGEARKGRRGVGDPTAVARGLRERGARLADHRRAHPARAPVAEVLLERVAGERAWSQSPHTRRREPHVKGVIIFLKITGMPGGLEQVDVLEPRPRRPWRGG